MSDILSKKQTIDEIVKAAKKLDKLELQILLTKLRVKNMQKRGIKPAANPAKRIKIPSMQEIDLWKHESRKNYAGR
jgi:hypothetical protein